MMKVFAAQDGVANADDVDGSPLVLNVDCGSACRVEEALTIGGYAALRLTAENAQTKLTSRSLS